MGMSTNIAILGAGEIGQAVAFALKQAGKSEVHFWDKQEGKVPDQKPLPETLSEADIVFLCVPSVAFRAVLKEIKPHIKAGAVLVWLTKGIERETNLSMDQVAQQEIEDIQYAALGGPLIAEEIISGASGIGVLASPFPEVFTKVTPLFAGSNMTLDQTPDIHGVALAAIIKNVYAMGLGASEELKLGINFRGWYVTQALKEMSQMIKNLDGESQTAYGPSGLGDLIATGFSPDSKNHQAGRELALTGKCDNPGEGLISLPQLIQLIGEETAEQLPLLSAIKRFALDGENVKETLQSLPPRD